MDDLQRAAALREMQAHPGWREVLKPILDARSAGLQRMLRDPSKSRKEKFPDDYIRGRLEEAEFLSEHPDLLVETIQQAAVEEKLVADRETRHEERAAVGWGAGANLPLPDEFTL